MSLAKLKKRPENLCNGENLNWKPGEFEMKPDRKCKNPGANEKDGVEFIIIFVETRPQQTVFATFSCNLLVTFEIACFDFMFTCIARFSTLNVCSQLTVVGIIAFILMCSLHSNGYFSLSKTVKISSILNRVMTSNPIVSERILCLSFLTRSIRSMWMAVSSIIIRTSTLILS